MHSGVLVIGVEKPADLQAVQSLGRVGNAVHRTVVGVDGRVVELGRDPHRRAIDRRRGFRGARRPAEEILLFQDRGRHQAKTPIVVRPGNGRRPLAIEAQPPECIRRRHIGPRICSHVAPDSIRRRTPNGTGRRHGESGGALQIGIGDGDGVGVGIVQVEPHPVVVLGPVAAAHRAVVLLLPQRAGHEGGAVHLRIGARPRIAGQQLHLQGSGAVDRRAHALDVEIAGHLAALQRVAVLNACHSRIINDHGGIVAGCLHNHVHIRETAIAQDIAQLLAHGDLVVVHEWLDGKNFEGSAVHRADGFRPGGARDGHRRTHHVDAVASVVVVGGPGGGIGHAGQRDVAALEADHLADIRDLHDLVGPRQIGRIEIIPVLPVVVVEGRVRAAADHADHAVHALGCH